MPCGIPFAAPPIGALRGRKPQSVEKWTAVRQAIAAGPSCIQQRGMSLKNGGDPGRLDEDCLYLNVFSPRLERTARLPVMAWIHGSALIFDSGGLPIYDGSALARRDVLMVTINYRPDALGFFSHPGLDRETPGGPVNFGLLDQIAALRWVWCKKWAGRASWSARCTQASPTGDNSVAKWHAMHFSQRSGGASLICTARRHPPGATTSITSA